jgi:hypothetical protein
VGLWWTGTGFFQVLRFPLPSIPLIAPHSSSSIIIWGWRNKPVVALVIVDSVELHSKRKKKNLNTPSPILNIFRNSILFLCNFIYLLDFNFRPLAHIELYHTQKLEITIYFMRSLVNIKKLINFDNLVKTYAFIKPSDKYQST